MRISDWSSDRVLFRSKRPNGRYRVPKGQAGRRRPRGRRQRSDGGPGRERPRGRPVGDGRAGSRGLSSADGKCLVASVAGDRTRVGVGKSGSRSVGHGGRRIIKREKITIERTSSK